MPAAAGLVVVAALLACCVAAGSVDPTPRTIRGRGIAMRLPAGWTGVIYERRNGLPILHAASFALPAVDGDDGALRAIPRMRRNDVLLVLLEGEPRFAGYPRRALPIRLRRADFAAPVEGMPLSRAFARVQFSTGRRAFDLWIEFGAKPAPAAAVRAADRALATLRLAARRTG